MNAPRSDALVFFGATGDLAFKVIFPVSQAMAGWGHLDRFKQWGGERIQAFIFEVRRQPRHTETAA